MRKLFDMDGPVMSFCTRLVELVFLNLLWLLCSIPIITIGASATALYDVTIRMAEKREGNVPKSFFRAFKSNFRQSTLLWLIMAAIGLVVAEDLYLAFGVRLQLSVAGFPLQFVLMSTGILLAAVWLMMLVWVFVLQGRYTNSVGRTLKNALLMSILHIPSTVLFVAMLLVCAYGAVTGFLLPLWIFIGIALAAWIVSPLYSRILKKQEQV